MVEVIIKTQTRIGKGELSGIIDFLEEKDFNKPGYIIDQAFNENEFTEIEANVLKRLWEELRVNI